MPTTQLAPEEDGLVQAKGLSGVMSTVALAVEEAQGTEAVAALDLPAGQELVGGKVFDTDTHCELDAPAERQALNAAILAAEEARKALMDAERACELLRRPLDWRSPEAEAIRRIRDSLRQHGLSFPKVPRTDYRVARDQAATEANAAGLRRIAAAEGGIDTRGD